MIRNFSNRNLVKTLQIYDRNENEKTGQTQKEETEPKRSSKAPETIKVEANANDILGMQNLSMISYNNKKLQEKVETETKNKTETNSNVLKTTEEKENTLENNTQNFDTKRINEYIQENYKNTTNNALDEATLEFLNKLVDAYSQKNDTTDVKKVADMGVKLAQAAEAKGVDKTSYIQSRIVEFLELQETNPNLSIEEMNKQLAIKQVNNSVLENVNTTLDSYLECNAEDIESLLALTESSLILGDEEPSLKEAYIDLQTVVYSKMAETGDLTSGEYYEYIKSDLINIFPQYSNFTEQQKEELSNFIDTLSPEEILEYQDAILNLPSCEENNYSESLKTLLNNVFGENKVKFNADETYSIPSGVQSEYKLKNATAKVSIDEIYETRLNTSFDADKIIQDTQTISDVKALSDSVTNYNAIKEIFDNASTPEEENNAIWQAMYLISGSTDDATMTTTLQQITNNSDLSFVDGKLVNASEQAKSRNASRSAEEKSDGVIKSTMKSVLDFVVERGKSYINFTDYENVDFNDLSSVSSYIEKTLDGLGNAAIDSSIGTGVYGMWTGATIHSLTAVAGLVSDLNNPEISTETALADFGSKLAQAGLEAVFAKYGETVGKFVGKYASKMFSSVTNGFKSLFNGVTSLLENKSSIAAQDLTEACGKVLGETNFWAQNVNTGYFSNTGKTIINDAINKTLNGRTTAKDVEAVLFRKLMDTSAPEYYSVGAALKGVKKAIQHGSIGKIELTSVRYLINDKEKVSLTEFTKQLMDVKNLRRFISQHGGTTVPTTVLRAEKVGMGALYNNIKINGTSISELRKACAGMSDNEFTQHVANLLKQFGGTTSSESFVGTSLNMNAFMEYVRNYPVRYQIFCPKGTQGAFIENLFAQGTKGYVDTEAAEFVLQAGCKFNITDAWVTSDGALAISADVLEKTIDAAGNAVWKKTLSVAIPLSLAALSADANNNQTNNSNLPKQQGQPEQPNNPNNNGFNYNNVNPNSNRNNNDVKPNNNSNVKPPLNGSNNTPSNNTTPNIDLSDIEMPETPGLNTNPEVKGIETTNENYSISGNINEQFKDDVKIPENQNSLNNKTAEEKFNEAVKNAENKAIEDAYKKYGKDAEVTTDTKVTIDENGNFKVDINVTVKGVNVNGTNTGNGNNTNDTQGAQGNGNSNNNNGTTNTQGTQGNGNSGTNSNGSGKTGSSLPDDATKLPDNAAANAQLQAGLNWTNEHFTDANGNFDGESFAGWVNDTYGDGQAYYYTGTDAQNALNDIMSGGIDNFWNNAGNYGSNNNNYGGEDWSWTGFDVFSVGGGWDNPWYSGGGIGGGGAHRTLDESSSELLNKRNSQFMMMQECR